MQLHDQEEDDLNRIKEESRRRRQAILEKYKNQHLQQQVEVKGLSEDAEKGTYFFFKIIYLFINFNFLMSLPLLVYYLFVTDVLTQDLISLDGKLCSARNKIKQSSYLLCFLS